MKNLKKSGPVTGSKAGAKGHKAMVTAKYAKHAKRGENLRGRPAYASLRRGKGGSAERRKVGGILERFGISVQSFNALRADYFEKHIAKRSLEELGVPYNGLQWPGVGCEKIREKHNAKRS